LSTDAAPASAPGDVEERSAVSVFIAPVSQRPLLAALTDLSGAGLIAPFHWVESAPDAGAAAWTAPRYPQPMTVMFMQFNPFDVRECQGRPRNGRVGRKDGTVEPAGLSLRV